MNVVITGSTKGLGLALAKEFIKYGHGVLINGRDRSTCALVESSLRLEFPNANTHIYACDITNNNSLNRLFDEAKRYFRTIDIWINNAGVTQPRQKFYDLKSEDISRVLDLNLSAAILGTKVVSNRLKDSEVFIYNMEGYGSNNMMTNFMTIYGTSKRALTYFTKSAALEVKGSKVKIGLLSPGMVITDLLLSGMPKDQKEQDRIKKFYNILADKPETVAKYLVKKMLQNKKNGASIMWLTNFKVTLRFLKSIFIKRNLIS